MYFPKILGDFLFIFRFRQYFPILFNFSFIAPKTIINKEIETNELHLNLFSKKYLYLKIKKRKRIMEQ
jgi:hypothetical protein